MTESYPPAAMPPPQWNDPLPPAENDPLPAQEQPGTTDVVKDQAANLGQGGVEAGKHAVGVAQEQASNVAAEAGRQATGLLRQAQGELTGQVAQGQQRLASELLSLGDELNSMADGSERNGVAADLARQGASRARGVGQWLDDRDPAQVVSDVQSFARRRPGVFLALAVGAGLVAGRLTRGLVAASHDDEAAAPALPGGPAEPDVTPAETDHVTPAETGYVTPADTGYLPETGAAAGYQPESDAVAGEDGSVAPLVDGLPAATGSTAWDNSAGYDESGTVRPDQVTPGTTP